MFLKPLKHFFKIADAGLEAPVLDKTNLIRVKYLSVF